MNNPAMLTEHPQDADDAPERHSSRTAPPDLANATVEIIRPPATPETPLPVAQNLAPIIKAINAVMAAVPFIGKTGKNKHAGWAYASEADVLAAIRPAMVEHGLVLTPNVVAMEHEQYTTAKNNLGTRVFVTVEHTLAHISGLVWPVKITAVGCAEDTQDKAAAQAGTSAQKYCLLRLFLVETGQDSDRGNSDRPPAGQGQNGATPPQDASFEEWVIRTMAEAEKQGQLNGWRDYHREGMKANVASGGITQEQYDWAKRLYFAKTRKEDQQQGS